MKHFHIYHRATLGKEKDYVVYKCADPECSHYIVPELLIGKMARCPKCKELFLINREQIRKRRRLLVCPVCSKRKKANVEKFLELLQTQS